MSELTHEQALSNEETRKHIDTVRRVVMFVVDKLLKRGMEHDASKLKAPELEFYAECTPKLKTATYMSDEYKQFLEDLKPALQHHYAKNRHHPEHFVNGIDDMNLIDLMELMCDWKASSLRHHDGNLLKSVDANVERFNLSPQLVKLMKNTAVLLDGEKFTES